MPKKPNNFISISEFKEKLNNEDVNCLAASLLRTENLKYHSDICRGSLKLDTSKEVGQAFLDKVDELSSYLGFDSTYFRRIQNPKEAPLYIYQIWGFEDVVAYDYMGDLISIKDFHVILGVRTVNGFRWFHKPGFDEQSPREVTSSDWEEIKNKFVNNPVPAYFSFEVPNI